MKLLGRDIEWHGNRAVDNIYERCKKSSKILNHTKNAEQMGNPQKPKPGAKSQKSPAASLEKQPKQVVNQLEQLATSTESKLEVIGSYLEDYESIVHSTER